MHFTVRLHIKASSFVYDLYYEDQAGNVIGKGTRDNGTNGCESNIGNFGFWLLGPANIKIGYLDHYFQVTDPVNNVMNFKTRFVAGRERFGPVNQVIEHSLSDQLMKDWILHNIEESGESENIIPALFENQELVVRKSELLKRKVL